jgi:hypothetical protein
MAVSRDAERRSVWAGAGGSRGPVRYSYRYNVFGGTVGQSEGVHGKPIAARRGDDEI